MGPLAAGAAPVRPAPPGTAFPRLLAGLRDAPVDLAEHLDRWGPLPGPRHLQHCTEELAASGLRGRGGAWFPVATKWQAVGARRLRRPVVVANGAEGEPASRKDALLLDRLPHLVLDGTVAAAVSLHAVRVVVYVKAPQADAVVAALHERRRHRPDPVAIEIATAPPAFIAGQESAAVHSLNGSPTPVPTFVGLQPIRDKGVGGRPTLVQNVETLAHVGLLARFGAPWFRSLGAPGSPGTTLLTVTGRWEQPTVLEAVLGAPLPAVLGLAPEERSRYQGVLLGGYGGGWVGPDVLWQLRLDEEAARAVGATLGAGVIALLPEWCCPLAEVARIVRYLGAESAGQCGPCQYGLAELTRRLEALAFGGPGTDRRLEPILETCALVEGRGACRHPDGAARMVRSACAVFAGEVAAHQHRGPCAAANRPGFLPVPSRPRASGPGLSLRTPVPMATKMPLTVMGRR